MIASLVSVFVNCRILYFLNKFNHTALAKVNSRDTDATWSVVKVCPWLQDDKREDLCFFSECIECVTIEMDKSVVNSERNIIVCVIYRPPNTDTLVFIELFNDILDIIKREDKLCYILGDFNINILNYDTHSATAQFMDTYENAFFRSLIALHGSRPHRQLWLIIYSPTICIHVSMFYKGFLLRIFLIISPCSISIICTKENKSNHIPVRETTHFATNRISVLHLLKLTEMSYMRRPAGIHNVPLHFF